jgi:hypothetical protein
MVRLLIASCVENKSTILRTEINEEAVATLKLFCRRADVVSEVDRFWKTRSFSKAKVIRSHSRE